jgi:hypothetical protein
MTMVSMVIRVIHPPIAILSVGFMKFYQDMLFYLFESALIPKYQPYDHSPFYYIVNLSLLLANSLPWMLPCLS